MGHASSHLRNRLLILKELISGDHRDAIPRANLVAERAADASWQVDRADLKGSFVPRAGDYRDAIDGTDHHARLAAGAHVLIEQGENFGQLLLGHFRVCDCMSVIGKTQTRRERRAGDFTRGCANGIAAVPPAGVVRSDAGDARA